MSRYFLEDKDGKITECFDLTKENSSNNNIKSEESKEEVKKKF